MKELSVESVFEILTSRSVSDLTKVTHNVISRYIPLKQTSIGIFSPAGDRLLIAGSTDEKVETASLVSISNNFDILKVLHQREPVLLKPFNPSSSLENLNEFDRELPSGNMMFPMEIESTVLGTLILYASAQSNEVDEEKIELIGDVAITASHALVGIHERDSYKVEHDRLKIELESMGDDYIESKFYFDLFMNNPDGMLVLDFDGKITSANPAAEALLCKDGNPLPEYFSELIEEDEKEKYLELMDGFKRGIYPREYEIGVLLPTGKRSILSVSISLVPRLRSCILLTLRDVTEQRIMERQLAESKNFLEKIVNSSVDAIMAADLNGTIILFNEAASRLTGWDIEEVVGVKNVRDFYPHGQAREIMKKLRSEEYGGKGRLEPQKIYLISKRGENIPALLSAAIIYDEDRELYTCGIFSDLREKIRSEEKISFILEKLEQSERQAELAELAGAMSHELNQPLTSIFGCAELLMRRLSGDKSYERYAKIILDEALRMSDIIKKIGKITKFETQTYMGKSRIVDIEKSAKQDANESDRKEPQK